MLANPDADIHWCDNLISVHVSGPRAKMSRVIWSVTFGITVPKMTDTRVVWGVILIDIHSWARQISRAAVNTAIGSAIAISSFQIPHASFHLERRSGTYRSMPSTKIPSVCGARMTSTEPDASRCFLSSVNNLNADRGRSSQLLYDKGSQS